MTVKDMHYDFKTKLNKIDSQQYRNLRIPEIDWKLNEAQELFIKMVSNPRLKNYLGFETSQRTIDDIRTIVVNDHYLDVYKGNIALPAEYWHYLDGRVLMSKGNCTDVEGDLLIPKHDDNFRNNTFYKSSFEWREVNATFFEGGLKIFMEDFTVTKVILDYIRKPLYIHNAEDFNTGQYNLPSGALLTGSVNCELPEETHREIVDIAVLLASNELQTQDYQNKIHKLKLNNLI